MSNEPIQIENYKGYEIHILQDDDTLNSPREWDNMFTFLCEHPKYNLGDNLTWFDKNEYKSWEDVKSMLEKKELAMIQPIYLYDHSGLVISRNPFACKFDSMQVGWAYIEKKNISLWYDDDQSEEEIQTNLLKCLDEEITVYNQHLNGEIFGYEIMKEGHEFGGSYGFYGSDFEENGLLDQAESEIDELFNMFNVDNVGVVNE